MLNNCLLFLNCFSFQTYEIFNIYICKILCLAIFFYLFTLCRGERNFLIGFVLQSFWMGCMCPCDVLRRVPITGHTIGSVMRVTGFFLIFFLHFLRCEFQITDLLYWWWWALFFAYILFLFLLYCWFCSGCISTCMDSLHYGTHMILRWLFSIQLVCAQHHWDDVNDTSTVQFIGQECIDWCKRHPANREQLNTTWSWSSSAGSLSARNIGSSIWCVMGLCRSRWICE